MITNIKDLFSDEEVSIIFKLSLGDYLKIFALPRENRHIVHRDGALALPERQWAALSRGSYYPDQSAILRRDRLLI